MATCRSHNSTGHNDRSTQPIIHQKNVKLSLVYNDIDLTDGWLTWPYRATQMNAIHSSFIPVSYTHLTLPTNREV